MRSNKKAKPYNNREAQEVLNNIGQIHPAPNIDHRLNNSSLIKRVPNSKGKNNNLFNDQIWPKLDQK